MLPTLTFNGKTFTAAGLEPGTGGCYRVRRRQIDLLRADTEALIGAVTVHGVLACATLQPDGKYWFSYADIDEIGSYSSYLQEVDEIAAALRLCGLVRVRERV